MRSVPAKASSVSELMLLMTGGPGQERKWEHAYHLLPPLSLLTILLLTTVHPSSAEHCEGEGGAGGEGRSAIIEGSYGEGVGAGEDGGFSHPQVPRAVDGEELVLVAS